MWKNIDGVDICNWLLLYFAVLVLVTVLLHANTWYGLVGYWGTNVIRSILVVKKKRR